MPNPHHPTQKRPRRSPRLNLLLAASALLYRLSWPLIDGPQTRAHALYSLGTKFIFVFVGLACAVALLPALSRSRKWTSTRAKAKEEAEEAEEDGRRRRAGSGDFVDCSAALLCMVVTTVNYVAGWRWGWQAVGAYFTRGGGGGSRFERVAVVGCWWVLSVGVLAVGAAQWRVVLERWERAMRGLWQGKGEVRRSGEDGVEKSGL